MPPPREPSSSAPATLPGIRATSTPEITPAGKQPFALAVTSEQADISGSTRGNREIRAACRRTASRSSDYTSPPLSLETGNLVRRSPELRRSRRDPITTVEQRSPPCTSAPGTFTRKSPREPRRSPSGASTGAARITIDAVHGINTITPKKQLARLYALLRGCTLFNGAHSASPPDNAENVAPNPFRAGWRPRERQGFPVRARSSLTPCTVVSHHASSPLRVPLLRRFLTRNSEARRNSRDAARALRAVAAVGRGPLPRRASRIVG